MQSEARSFTID